MGAESPQVAGYPRPALVTPPINNKEIGHA